MNSKFSLQISYTTLKILERIKILMWTYIGSGHSKEFFPINFQKGSGFTIGNRTITTRK